ncbi:hypothetical protein [Shewanella nanhaiensis]|uniref:Uncharacterized protein n=1 Tax=Shewanella nanhaiensis TaxID=2864872 RepID=A0ABS7E3U3_9GAMM|nr:hypothetical protein [Shewanella nanhaiensis]MBW8184018.1 hypothetical protein [Shewanella nanhaiensis]
MKLFSIFLAGLVVSFSASAEFGEKVNCRTETTGQIAIYSGYASCNAYVDGRYYVIDDYVQPTTHQYTYINDIINGRYASCRAQVPFHSYQDVTSEVCDYKPISSVGFFRIEGSTETLVSANGDDFDGTVVKKELWVDGVKQSSSNSSVDGNVGDVFVVKSRVTDNDGYYTDATKSITIIYRPEDICDVNPRLCR